MEKAWTFYRRSTDKQELSIDDQRRECQAFALSRGWEIVREFAPLRGYASGMTIDRDATFREMLRLAESAHGVTRLIVYDVSRFGRLPAKLKIYYEQHLLLKGIRIAYVKGDFRDDDSIGDILTQVVKHSEAHEYSRTLSIVTLRGSKSRAALGHSTGGPAPYGYDRQLIDAGGKPLKILDVGEHAADGQHVIWKPSSNARVVRRIFERFLAGLGIKRIAEELNAEGIPAPRARFWGKSIIHHILRNRAYVGERIYNRLNCKSWRRGEGGPFRKPREEWVIKATAHEPIVSADLFERVQKAPGTRQFAAGRTYARDYLLTGLARCGNCGFPLSGSRIGEYRRYSCTGYSRIGKSVCRSYYVSADELEDLALQLVRDKTNSPAWRAAVRKALSRFVRAHSGGSDVELEGRRREISDLNRQIDNVVRAIRSGYSEALATSLRSMESQRDALRSAITQLEGRQALLLDQRGLEDEIFKVAEDIQATWAEASIDERKSHLRKFIYGLKVDREAKTLRATYHVYRLPGLLDSHLSVKAIAGAGRGLNLHIPPEILPWISSQSYILSRPYSHRRARG